MKIYNLMTPDVVTVRTDSTLKDVARTLVEHEISGAPVLDAKGAVAGVISEADIVLAADGFTEPRRPHLFDLIFRAETADAIEPKLRARTAGEAMSSPAVTVAPHEPLSAAVKLMRDHSVNRLPVVDEQKHLVGIISRGDLLRAFVRDDDEIEKEIRSDILLRGVYVNPRAVDVKVEDGEVTLTGEVESRGKAELLTEFVERVPGVIAVKPQLTWRTTKPAPRGIRAPV